MKHHSIRHTLLCALLSLGLLTACAPGASSSQAVEEPMVPSIVTGPGEGTLEDSMQPVVYRGQVGLVTEQTVQVMQVLPGYNYGYDSILFHIDEGTQLLDNSLALQEGAFVEVLYNGVLTRSDPPAATADEILVLSSVSDQMLVNGEILTATQVENGYRIILRQYTSTDIATLEKGLTVEYDENKQEQRVVLNVPALALEHLTEADLVEGALVSAVTNGVAALSMPPQYPVHALLPLTLTL